jgi:hypothetical protein
LIKEKRLGIKEEDGGQWFYCALIENLKEGEAREMGKRPAAARLTRAGEVLEVGGDPDRWGRPGRERKGRGGERRWWACAVSWAGRREAGGVWMGRERMENEKKGEVGWAAGRS